MKLRGALEERFALSDGALALIVSDSFGRPWRQGIVNVAIGVSGMAPHVDYRGQMDSAGYELSASILAVADEVAAAAELVMHKLAGRPVAIVRGYRSPLDGAPGTGRDLIMDPARDLFR
jgi:coenzyme F420-0:L-glutamate ligase/coenzyme F420-1:gamma-L-glutamate ligase